MQCPADCLAGGALHLAFDQGRIDRAADVLHDVVPEWPDDAGLEVDADMCDVGHG